MSPIRTAAARRRAREAERARYRDLIEAGVCPRCAQEDARPGRVMGPKCAASARVRYRAYRAAKLAQPERPCVACLNRPPAPGRKTCQPCADRYAQYRLEAAVAKRVAA